MPAGMPRIPRFTFGTGKVGELAGFASAISLGHRRTADRCRVGAAPVSTRIRIDFLQAGGIAVLGLIVNLVSARCCTTTMMTTIRSDDQTTTSHHHDTNLRAAYLHVLADALTSVLAILGLLAGWYLGWIWMDAAAGLARRSSHRALVDWPRAHGGPKRCSIRTTTARWKKPCARSCRPRPAMPRFPTCTCGAWAPGSSA